MAAYWAVKGTGCQTQYALAHWSGLGRVVLMHTTDGALGPGRYTLITRTEKRTTVKYQHDNDLVLPYLQSTSQGVILLTESQRTPEWFLLQKFRITGTGAYGIWKYISKMTANLLDENMNAVIEILSMQGNGQELVEPPDVDNKTYKTETLGNNAFAESSEDLLKQESTGLGIKSNYHRENLVMEVTGRAYEVTTSTEQHFDNSDEIMVHGLLQIQGLSRRNSE
jgi:hypothetical protein